MELSAYFFAATPVAFKNSKEPRFLPGLHSPTQLLTKLYLIHLFSFPSLFLP